MRQLKAFMKAKKGVCSKKCECLTINMWRCADFQNGYEFCGCDETKTADMVSSVLSWFKNTPVYKDLDAADKEQALANAQEILEGAGDGIAPFYQAMKKGKTFAVYAREMGLDVDESGTCDSTIYEDEEAFIIYISAAGTIDCKYLALVARRGRTPTKELINKEAISDYLDWVTTSSVTYQFKDWDDEILKVGTVEKGETPEAPTDLPPREGYRFTGWSPSIRAIEYDTTFVAQYELDVTPVQSVSNIPTKKFYVGRGNSITYTFNYAPANANDFSNLVVEDIDITYSHLPTSSTVSYDNGVATVTTVGNNVGSGIEDGRVNINLNNTIAGQIVVMVGDSEVAEVQSISEPQGNTDRIAVGETKTFTFNYFPERANDFSNIEIYDNPDCYQDEHHTTLDVSYNDGNAVVEATAFLEGDAEVEIRAFGSSKTFSFPVLPAGTSYIIYYEAGNERVGGLISKNSGEYETEGMAYASVDGAYYLDGDDLIIRNRCYEADPGTVLHPIANEGYEFKGWYYDESYGDRNKVNDGDYISEDDNIYAIFDTRDPSY